MESKAMTQPSPFAAATLAPLLNVRNGASALDFYKRAFDAHELFVVRSPDGDLVARLAIGTSEFWIADESPAHLNFAPDTLNGTTVRLILVVPDPDAAFEHAVTAGATVISPMADRDYGWRDGRLADPFGHHWEIGKPLDFSKP